MSISKERVYELAEELGLKVKQVKGYYYLFVGEHLVATKKGGLKAYQFMGNIKRGKNKTVPRLLKGE